MTRERQIADALATLLQRGFRLDLHRRLISGVATGLDESTYPVLSALARLGESSAARVAAEIGLDRSGVSRRLSALEHAGLVRVDADERDARKALATLTPAGREAIEITRSRLDDAIGAHLAEWNDHERRMFADLLTRFTARAL